jgi:hypothetical protein
MDKPTVVFSEKGIGFRFEKGRQYTDEEVAEAGKVAVALKTMKAGAQDDSDRMAMIASGMVEFGAEFEVGAANLLSANQEKIDEALGADDIVNEAMKIIFDIAAADNFVYHPSHYNKVAVALVGLGRRVGREIVAKLIS